MNYIVIQSELNINYSVLWKQDHGNYAFGYDIVDHKGAKNFRKESGDAHGNKVGSYGLHDIDGRLRIVDYVSVFIPFLSYELLTKTYSFVNN